ncbi:MAG: thioredoxin [Chthoniobacteraceae bacterium]
MASPNVLNLTDANFDAELAKSTVPMLVDFWAPWCGPCIQLAPVIDEIANERIGKAIVAKVNVDESPALAGKFRVNSIPALLFFKGGQPVGQLVGRQPKSDILAKLDGLS